MLLLTHNRLQNNRLYNYFPFILNKTDIVIFTLLMSAQPLPDNRFSFVSIDAICSFVQNADTCKK